VADNKDWRNGKIITKQLPQQQQQQQQQQQLANQLFFVDTTMDNKSKVKSHVIHPASAAIQGGNTNPRVRNNKAGQQYSEEHSRQTIHSFNSLIIASMTADIHHDILLLQPTIASHPRNPSQPSLGIGFGLWAVDTRRPFIRHRHRPSSIGSKRPTPKNRQHLSSSAAIDPALPCHKALSFSHFWSFALLQWILTASKFFLFFSLASQSLVICQSRDFLPLILFTILFAILFPSAA
jgi:hypothetical protein